MATTTGGSTYVTSTDLVANYPTASLALANRVDLVASGEIVYNTGNYTITVADILGGKTIIQDSASATTVTLPSSSLVNGMQAKISNVGAGTVTVSGGTLLGTATINQYGGITAVYKTSITSWWLLPFSGSVGAANFTNTATGTYTGYKYITFTGNGSLVIDRSGFVDLLAIGGGAAGGGSTSGSAGTGGGGAGGYLAANSIYLAAGTYTVTIGGGGTGASGPVYGPNGSPTVLGPYVAPGGGGGAPVPSAAAYNGNPGASGGGGGYTGIGGIGIITLGNNGGTGASSGAFGGGGGGGASAVGANGSTSTGGGAGGAGTASSITGTAVTRAGGGGGGALGTAGGAGGAGGGGAGTFGTAGTNATINTGGGGGGSGNGNFAGGNGGSGVLIVRVAV